MKVDLAGKFALVTGAARGIGRSIADTLAANGADLAMCVNGWYWNTLDPTAKNAFDKSIGRIDGGRDLKAVYAGRAVLISRLKKIRNDKHIPDQEKEGAA